MKPINHKVAGFLYEKAGEVALLRSNAAAPLFLRYAFIIQGPEDPIFPAFLLDDWGREIRRLELYRWVAANGNEFPRAEIFGYEIDGRETQVFLRALELYARYLCYVYPDKDSPIPSGRRVHHGLIPDPTASEPVKSSPPDDLEFPLNRAKLSWWRVNPEQLLAWGYKPIP